MTVVLITLMATFAIQLGYFLWKVAADSLPTIGVAPASVVIRGFLGSWRWMLGLFATVVGWLLFIKATDLGEVSIVQPLMSVGDLFLVLMAVVFLHERLTRIEWFGLSLTVAGAASLSFEADVIEPAAIIWSRLAVLIVLAIVILAGLLLAGRRSQRPEAPMAIAVGIGFGTGAVLTELMTAYITMDGRQLESTAFLFNPVLPFMVAANIAGLIMLQSAFQRGRAAVIIPVQLAVANVFVVVAGLMVFSEVITFFRLSGISLIIAGAALLHDREQI